MLGEKGLCSSFVIIKKSGAGSIVVGCSKTEKAQNEDYCDLYTGTNLTAIAIADGLGSSTDAHIASRLAVESFLNNVKSADSRGKVSLNHIDIRRFWENTVKNLRGYYEENKRNYMNKSDVLQTTLITLIELKDRYEVSYIGNGSIWHIRGDFWRFWNKRWPWCMSDLMIGHSFLDQNGREVLYGFLEPTGLTSSMSIKQLTVWKDTYCGEVFILSTDGISSSDHLKVGRDTSHKLWIEVNPHIESLINNGLKEYFEGIFNKSGENTQLLKKVLEKFLNERTFDDDATLGIIMSNKTIEHFLNKNTPS